MNVKEIYQTPPKEVDRRLERIEGVKKLPFRLKGKIPIGEIRCSMLEFLDLIDRDGGFQTIIYDPFIRKTQFPRKKKPKQDEKGLDPLALLKEINNPTLMTLVRRGRHGRRRRHQK